jgi:fibro-slime domain-containing protein
MKKLFTMAALAASVATSFAATTTLTGTVRDFNADGQNFEGAIIGLRTGMVENTLTGASPTLTALGKTLVNEANFNQWFTKSTAGEVKSHAITLSDAATPGTFSYSSSAFFPIDGQLLGNQGNAHNYHFTYAISAQFGYKPGAGQVFSFTGDDDVWVFFDKKLGIDLGGVHGAAGTSVNLDTFFNGLGGRGEGNYAFDFFFAERHLTESNLKISTSLELTPTPAIPEPSTYALMLAGLAAMGFVARRRR